MPKQAVEQRIAAYQSIVKEGLTAFLIGMIDRKNKKRWMQKNNKPIVG